MHTIELIKSDMFEVQVNGDPGSISDVLPDWQLHDRLGLVIDAPLGGLGASHLVQIAITRFYEAAARRTTELKVYPEIYAFHVGKPRGSHAAFDFWPARREVMLSADPKDLLDAINDRGITRLVVPDRAIGAVEFRPKEMDTALDRIVSAFAYEPAGRTNQADIVIKGINKRTEINPSRVIKPVYLDRPVVSDSGLKETDSAYISWLKLRQPDVTPEEVAIAKAQREALLCGVGTAESYRRISVTEALSRMNYGAV